MAGMLAGVESARRRRIHQNIVCSSSPSPSTPPAGGASLSLRRSLFFPSSTPSPPLGRSRGNQGQVDEKLGQLARQAKKRLDERLGAQSKSLPPSRDESGNSRMLGWKKKKNKGWGASAMARLGGMKSDAESESECVICLEQLRREEEVVNLDCSHTFHMQCIIPWLHSHSICPCCRTPTSFSS